jgi:hypothetical protein
LCNRITKEFTAEIDFILSEFEKENIKGVNVKTQFINDIGFNAFCTISDGIDYIGINVGCVVYLHEIIGRIVASDNFYCIGESAGIVNRTVHLWPELIEHSNIFDYQLFDAEDSATNISIFHMLNQATRFLLHHELAHIWNGHHNLRVALSKDSKSIIDEMGQNASFMLELDADHRAIHWLILMATQTMIFDEKRYMQPDRDYLLFLTASAIYISLRTLLYLREYHKKTYSSHITHPTPEDRLGWAMENFYGMIVFHTNFPVEAAMRIVSEAIRRSEAGFSKIFSCEKFDIFDNGFLNSNIDKKRDLYSEWSSLIYELEQHKRGMKLPKIRKIGEGNSSISLLKSLSEVPRVLDNSEFIQIGRNQWRHRIELSVNAFLNDTSLILERREANKYIEGLEELLSVICSSRIDIDQAHDEKAVMRFWNIFRNSASDIFNLLAKLLKKHDINKLKDLVLIRSLDPIMKFCLDKKKQPSFYRLDVPEGSGIPPSIYVCAINNGVKSRMTHQAYIENCYSMSAICLVVEHAFMVIIERLKESMKIT